MVEMAAIEGGVPASSAVKTNQEPPKDATAPEAPLKSSASSIKRDASTMLQGDSISSDDPAKIRKVVSNDEKSSASTTASFASPEEEEDGTIQQPESTTKTSVITDATSVPPSSSSSSSSSSLQQVPRSPSTPIVSKTRQYMDCAALPDPPRHFVGGGDNVPEQIHKMLAQIQMVEGASHIVSWLEHGRAFRIHDAAKFEDVLRRYSFPQAGLEGFRSTLLDFGFRRLLCDKEVYYHELFLRTRPGLCVNMQSSSSNATQQQQQTYAEPDLCQYPPMPKFPSMMLPSPTVSSSPLAVAKPTSTTPVAQRHPVTLYCDCAGLPDPTKYRNPGEAADNFAEKVYQLLEQAEREGFAHVISFLDHGRAFKIHDELQFEEMLSKRLSFAQKKIGTFKMELHLYGFQQLSYGRDEGSYYHELFLRSRPGLCANLSASANSTNNPTGRPEPNFLEYTPMPPFASSHAQPATLAVPAWQRPPLAAYTPMGSAAGHTAPYMYGGYPYPPPHYPYGSYPYPMMVGAAMPITSPGTGPYSGQARPTQKAVNNSNGRTEDQPWVQAMDIAAQTTEHLETMTQNKETTKQQLQQGRKKINAKDVTEQESAVVIAV